MPDPGCNADGDWEAVLLITPTDIPERAAVLRVDVSHEHRDLHGAQPTMQACTDVMMWTPNPAIDWVFGEQRD